VSGASSGPAEFHHQASSLLCCPDSLKSVLSAADAAAALAEGCREAGGEADEVPLGDGGEGTAEALRAVLGGEWRAARVDDPLGRKIDARFLVLPDGRAVVESAEAIGLWRLDRAELDPLRASSRGLGQLVLAAAEAGPRELVVTLGGSATVDGGAGLREVLPRLPLPTIAACDVRNPLLGARGAARAFGPQKGASPEQVEELERRLAAMTELGPFADLPGAGSAGGLGAAFAALGARLEPGIELVLDAVGFTARLRGATLAVTGEGAVDRSSLEGKTVAGVLAACRRADVPCVVFGGRLEPGMAGELREAGAARTFALGGDPGRAREDLFELGRALGAS